MEASGVPVKCTDDLQLVGCPRTSFFPRIGIQSVATITTARPRLG